MTINHDEPGSGTGICRAELDELQKSYQLTTIWLKLDNRSLELVKVTNMDDLLDQISDVDELPYWAEIWPAAIGLAIYIFRNPKEFDKQHILELGAGTGLAGIAAKLTGADVTQSDFIETAFKFIRINCLQNHVPVGDQLLADWRNFPTGITGFDQIIGADILYEKTLHSHLQQVFNQALKPGGTIYLADPGRGWGRQFISELMISGWKNCHTQIPVFYEERTIPIDIYRLNPPGNLPTSISL